MLSLAFDIRTYGQCHQTHPFARDLDDRRQVRDPERLLLEHIRRVPPSVTPTPVSKAQIRLSLSHSEEKAKTATGKAMQVIAAAQLTLPAAPRTPRARSPAWQRRSFQPEARPSDSRHTMTVRWSTTHTRPGRRAAMPTPRS